MNSPYELLSFEEISDVQPKPGLYAWYSSLRIGKADLKTPENTTKALHKIAEAISYPSVSMKFNGNLNLLLEGELKHVFYGHTGNKYSNQLKEVIDDPDGRQIISEVFELVVPLLCCPLYIGVSKNLQKRLSQHSKLIHAYLNDKTEQKIELLNTTPVDEKEDLENDESFAMRIAERNIDPNNLIVGVIYPKENNPTVRKAIEAAETLLNRIFYPILGRR